MLAGAAGAEVVDHGVDGGVGGGCVGRDKALWVFFDPGASI